ncbi:hypothetical protein [Streptomyces sp. NPDC001843]|uniref:hypothetical protein n=1 Tax=Streptomyces sp. NPDC001843 TaxID=3364617 RepID=UPI003685E1E4
MGERLSGGGVPGRRRAHPDGAGSGPWDARDAAALETALATALRGGDHDPVAEQRAVAAFRSARGADGHRARTRRRDDWRVTAERRAGRSVRMTLGVVFAGLTLGGVAVAAIGSGGSSADGTGAGAGRETARPSALAPGGPGGAAPSASSGGPRPTDRPARAQDTEAHCRAYEQVVGRGKALEGKAWQRLVADAGGKDKVAAYCSRELVRATAAANGHSHKTTSGNGTSGKGTSGKGTSGKGTSGHGTSGNGTSGNGTSGNGTSGNTSGGTDSAGGNGRASGGQGGGKQK